MSTYYYLLCHDCKVKIAAARQSGGNPAGQMDENLYQFIVDHRGHKVAITDEHESPANPEKDRQLGEDDWWTLTCAVANMRSADRDERTIEARWQLAEKLARIADKVKP